MEFYKETKVAGGDCETPPGPTCRPGLGVLTTWPRVLGPQGLLGWALGKKGVPRKETMGGHLLPSSVTGGPALEKPCAGSPSPGLQPPPPSLRQTHLDSPEDELGLPSAPCTGARASHSGPLEWLTQAS